ncbi:vascular cell adhesion protein 1-like [Chaetodon trifascialis]|uniref:vascular cell adhesion protein 1-like n=1 Tax=Chaetodon trifascialis TaxID=109706 RepID=UPI003995E572
MFFMPVVASLMSFLHGCIAYSCDQQCADEPVFTPSRLVVKFGDSASARCSVCQHCHSETHGLETSLGVRTINGTTAFWRVDTMTEWDTSAMCYYNVKESGCQCFSILPVTVYQPPHSVSISSVNHTGPMREDHQYTLQCTVQDVAPVENLAVTFYKGQTALGSQRSNSYTKQKTPVTEIFTLNITPSKADDGVQYWCEAKLELGPEGPQPPPVVVSQNITATVLYKPRPQGPSHLDPVTITEGSPLHLNCSAGGNPSPSYTWMLPLASPPLSGGSVFTIKHIKPADAGQYTCSVSNTVGTVTMKFTVAVQGLETTSTTTTRQPTTVGNSSTRNRLTHRFILYPNCADKPVFRPSRLVVQFGYPVSARCSACRHACHRGPTELEVSAGVTRRDGSMMLWKVHSLTEWDTSAKCYYTDDDGNQCCSTLPVTVYQPPDNVQIRLLADPQQMFEDHLYTLHCEVQDVAPVENLIVTFYKGQEVVSQQWSTYKEKTPVTEIFTFDFRARLEDDGAHFRCEAKLELGPEGPQPPPVVMSQNITTTVKIMEYITASSTTIHSFSVCFMLLLFALV